MFLLLLPVISNGLPYNPNIKFIELKERAVKTWIQYHLAKYQRANFNTRTLTSAGKHQKLRQNVALFSKLTLFHPKVQKPVGKKRCPSKLHSSLISYFIVFPTTVHHREFTNLDKKPNTITICPNYNHWGKIAHWRVRIN